MSRMLSAAVVLALSLSVMAPVSTQCRIARTDPSASAMPGQTSGRAHRPRRWRALPLGVRLSGRHHLTPVGSDVPVLDGTIDPAADSTSPEGSLEATLPPGTYVASVTALGVTEPPPRGAPPERRHGW